MKLRRRTKKDDGAANTISFMFIMFFVLILILSFLDIGMYFQAKGDFKSAAENGARNVALYGGTQGSFRAVKGGQAKDPVAVVNESIKSKYTTTTSKGKPLAEMKKIECGPSTANAGAPVWCSIEYKYNGMAGVFSLFNISTKKNVKVYGTSVSEVNVK